MIAVNSLSTVVSGTDLFCGLGGSDEGARRAGVELNYAVNHWQHAVDVHAKNFPKTTHDCADISQTNPRRYRRTDVLIASPECTNHSIAKGARRKSAQLSLLESASIDPSAERSRATMWDVPRFAEIHRYEAIVIENVVDAYKWELWESWLHAMTALGYEHRVLFLNSMFFPPTPQSRDRMYVVFWRRGRRAPDLEFRPAAFCPHCERRVQAIQSWKKAHYPWGRYGWRRQYTYNCPHCAGATWPYIVPAYTVIDWTLPIERIGDRKEPLEENTLRRIQVGLQKFAGRPLAISHIHPQSAPDDHAHTYTLSGSLPAQTGTQNISLALPPFAVQTKQWGSDRRSDEPLPTQTAEQTLGLAVPPFIQNRNTGHPASGIGDPLPTQLTTPHADLIVPPFLTVSRGTETGHEVDRPLTTQVACAIQHGLCVPPYLLGEYTNPTYRELTGPLGTVVGNDKHRLVVPPSFLMADYSNPVYTAIWQAVSTITSKARHMLLEPGTLPAVEDCGFRMLVPFEIKLAMAFPADYIIYGSQRDQVKLCGNAVTPPVMEWIMSRVIPAVFGTGALLA